MLFIKPDIKFISSLNRPSNSSSNSSSTSNSSSWQSIDGVYAPPIYKIFLYTQYLYPFPPNQVPSHDHLVVTRFMNPQLWYATAGANPPGYGMPQRAQKKTPVMVLSVVLVIIHLLN